MMCKPEELSNECSTTSSSQDQSHPPPMHAESDLSGCDGSDSDDNNQSGNKNATNTISMSNAERRRQRKLRQFPNKQINNNNNDDRNGHGNSNGTVTATSVSSSVLSGLLHGVLWVVVSLNLPFILSGQDVANKLYQKASFEYDPKISLFDNTIWTYGTDYALATITAGFASWILHTSNRSASPPMAKRLARVSASMLFLYAISTGAGGVAHHTFLTIESRNTLVFRVLWTICVGTVCLAPTAMGMIGNECLRIFQLRKDCPPLLKTMPRISDAFWLVYGAVITISCLMGGMSFQRPACDIFIGGITQTPCTFYCMAFIYLVEHPKITTGIKIRGLVGFIMNAFMLPLYPMLILKLGWSLAATNTLLHSNLCVAWSLQGLTLQRIVKALVEEQEESEQITEEQRLQEHPPTVMAKKIQ